MENEHLSLEKRKVALKYLAENLKGTLTLIANIYVSSTT